MLIAESSGQLAEGGGFAASGRAIEIESAFDALAEHPIDLIEQANGFRAFGANHARWDAGCALFQIHLVTSCRPKARTTSILLLARSLFTSEYSRHD